jgi:precorrin-6x reductase
MNAKQLEHGKRLTKNISDLEDAIRAYKEVKEVIFIVQGSTNEGRWESLGTTSTAVFGLAGLKDDVKQMLQLTKDLIFLKMEQKLAELKAEFEKL